MMELHVVRAFVNDEHEHGNELGVFLDGKEVPAEVRQQVATELGFAETVFVDDPARGVMQLNTPVTELVFAGHPTVGTAWLLAQEHPGITAIRPPAGEVGVRVEGDSAHVTARPSWCPPFELVQMDSPADVDALTGPPGEHDLVSVWAWSDRERGRVRARVFIGRLGIPEDEATGSAAIPLSASLGTDLAIRQARGSILLVRPLSDGSVELGGRVVLDDVRDYEPFW
jgi:predicted PhzF superfamily epimerase YddE/YHI9